MTPQERIARAHRAQSFLDEFIAPMFVNIREEYTDRITEVAATEFNPLTRAEKITTLSVALRVLGSVESGLKESIRDGELACSDKLRTERIEQMTDAQQRLLKITGY